MDLDPTREQKDFRAEVRNWLKENIPKEPLPSMDTQEGFELHRTLGIWFMTISTSGIRCS
mgnify:CR=1 FL=1